MTTESTPALGPVGAFFRALILGTVTGALVLGTYNAVLNIPVAPGWLALHAVLAGILIAFGGFAWIAGPLLARAPLTAASPAAASVTVDALTRLPNRRAITGTLLDHMANAERYGSALSVGLIEVANRKVLTDALGPKAHDRAVETMAQALTDTLRMPDKAGRYDTSTLLVVLPHTDDKGAEKIMQRLRTAVAKRVMVRGDTRQKIDTRVRIAEYRRGEDLEQFLTRALLVEPRAPRKTAKAG